MTQELHFEITDVEAGDAGLRLELRVEGQRIAVASAAAEVLDAMQASLSLSREDVTVELRGALRDHLSRKLAQVTLDPPQADPPGSLRFISRYLLRDGDTISTGVVWYDVETSETGPEALPAAVRNKLRHEVHRSLTKEGTHARAIIDLLQPVVL